jgi:NAD(P)H-hydrate epimerase
MRPVLTPAEMGEADRRTIDAGTPGPVLMERAGRAVAREVLRLTGGAYGRHAVIVCGKGNNGGDGLVVARVLAARGLQVHVFRLEDAITHARFARVLARADVAVDAMFGTGFRGALEGDAAAIAEAFDASGVPVVAVDIPSGVDGATGAIAGDAVRATSTVTFSALKPGLCFEPGRAHAGEVHVAEIGIDLGETRVGQTEPSDLTSWLPRRDPDTHKWAVGAVYVVGGSAGMTGAPLMVSHAAMRTGAGMVWCGLPGRRAAAAASGSEVITKALPKTDADAIGSKAARAVLADASRFGAVVIGPGLGRDSRTAAAVVTLLRELTVPVVLDADGLNALAGDLTPLRDRQSRGAVTILTPHEGEYARLTGEHVGDDRIAAARRLVGASGAVVLLKGSTTVVAEPGFHGRVALNPTGGPWLATAGTGDVLSGVVGALCARGLGPFEAATAGAWLHGRAADHAGHTGLVAPDLVGAIPAALRDVQAPADRAGDPAD